MSSKHVGCRAGNQSREVQLLRHRVPKGSVGPRNVHYQSPVLPNESEAHSLKFHKLQ